MKEKMTRREFVGMGGALTAGAVVAALTLRGRSSAAETGGDPWQYYTVPYWGRRVLEDPPPSLVDQERRLVLGCFKEPIRSINYLDAAIFGSGFDRLKSRLGLKEWTGYYVQHPGVCLQFGLVDAFRTLGVSQFVLYERTSKTAFSYMGIALGKGYTLAETTWDGHTHIQAPNGYHLEYVHELDRSRKHTVLIDMRATGRNPAIKGELVLHEDLVTIQPMVVSLPVKPCHHMYTHKVPLRVEGSLTVGERRFLFEPRRDIAIMDEHKSYYPPETYWNWATFAGYTEEGRFVGLNLTDNRTFHNQQYWNENGIWLENTLSMIGAGHFVMDPERPMESDWRIYEEQDRVNLRFTPECQWIDNVYSLGFFNMNYYDILGTFNGYLRDNAGNKIELRDFVGIGEKYHVWSWSRQRSQASAARR
jgi:hypothetical protein